MSRIPRTAVPAPSPASRPTLLDYLLILGGCATSSFLASFAGPPRTIEPENIPFAVAESVPAVLVELVALSQGVVLLWPLFYGLQWLRGRPQSLTAGEWLWGVAWLGTVLYLGV